MTHEKQKIVTNTKTTQGRWRVIHAPFGETRLKLHKWHMRCELKPLVAGLLLPLDFMLSYAQRLLAVALTVAI